jgi:hypothetical protein
VELEISGKLYSDIKKIEPYKVRVKMEVEKKNSGRKSLK